GPPVVMGCGHRKLLDLEQREELGSVGRDRLAVVGREHPPWGLVLDPVARESKLDAALGEVGNEFGGGHRMPRSTAPASARGSAPSGSPRRAPAVPLEQGAESPPRCPSPPKVPTSCPWASWAPKGILGGAGHIHGPSKLALNGLMPSRCLARRRAFVL